MANKLIDEKINDYVDALSSGAPTPGGGAVAALTAAQGAALIMMVANLTIGKKKYAEFEELNVAAIEEAKGYLDQLMAGVDEDKKAFGQVASMECQRNLMRRRQRAVRRLPSPRSAQPKPRSKS